MILADLNKLLVGRQVADIQSVPQADEGLYIVFDDGSAIEIGYSSCEGSTKYLAPPSSNPTDVIWVDTSTL